MDLAEGYAQAIFRFALTGDPELMTFSIGFHSTVDGTAGELGAKFGSLVADYATNVLPAAGDLFAGWTWQDVVMEANPSDSAPIRIEAPVNLIGSAVQSASPQNVTYLVRKLSPFTGRANRGRMYPPCFNLAEGNIDQAGNLSVPARANLQAGIDGWFSDFIADDGEFVINHTNPAITPTVVQTLVVDGRVATQRRRLR